MSSNNTNARPAQQPRPKKRGNRIIQTVKWGMSGLVFGFLITFGISLFEAIRTGLLNVLADLVGECGSLMIEIASRNPAVANLIWQDQSLAQANLAQDFGSAIAFWNNHDPVNAALAQLKYFLLGVFYLAEWSLKVDLLKFISVLCSFMVFVFAGVLGGLDGLLSRYIRTAEGGRESTYGYHFLADSVFKIPFLLVLVYLALPFSISPLLIVCALSLLIFMFSRISTSHLKKFM